MTTRPLTALLLLTAAAGAAPAAADAALRETTYDVTVEVRQDEAWQAATKQVKSCDVDTTIGSCTYDAVGSGRTRLVLRTPTPQRVRVMTGAGRPMITYAIDRGIPLKGSQKILGTFTETYGGLWDAANPDVTLPTGDCGDRIVRTDIALGWQERNTLVPVMSLPDRFDCPTGPYEGFTFTSAPGLQEVLGTVSERKFGRTKQFTVRGKRSWEAVIEPIQRSTDEETYSRTGRKTVTWSWEATFRMTPRKRKRR